MSLAPLLPPPGRDRARPSPLGLALAAPALAAALAILAPACSATTMPPGLDAFLRRAQDAACERLVACQSVPDVATCKDRRLGRLDAGSDCLADEIAAGLVLYHPSREDACIQALRNGACTPGAAVPEPFGVCDRVLAGTVPPGGTCWESRQCADSGVCGSTRLCQQRRGVGDTCGDLSEHVCSYTTFCDNGECRRIAKAGERCREGTCAHGLYCAEPSRRCVPTLPVGTTCDPHAAGACGDAYCDPVTSRCAPPPAPGDDCSVDSLCGGGATCFEGVCVGYPGEGEPCLAIDSTLCGLGLVCDGGTCVLPMPTECR